MILTIDIGNSNTVFVSYNGHKNINERVVTGKELAYEYYKLILKDLNIKPEAVIVSCVVPRIQEDVRRAIFDVCGLEALFINSTTVKDFDIRLDNPMDIGADFIATAMGAMGKYDCPIIIADIGSATKLTYVNNEGAFCGGIIIPGIGTSVEAMYSYIPHLPQVPLEIPSKVIGTGTIDAIQSGIMYGIIAQIEGLARKMEQEIGQECVKLLTGGYASLIHEHTEGFIYEPDLLNDGLNEIYKRGMIV
ncbi:type III pantothenate kinase [Erysipelothrix sp. HDW6A]|uniref:type III pantothenate kinase n=1 Tax=Erysipelothrix sp. HDW6A TaxID=2714928 RepID=UPI00140A8682|nr:type III pantothenate kinase [Erysipelothrix sp. HDW6A]QIK56863.1 type III pantothenate kinase [Erysipelothrix sp. HDW6A]